ncbi:MAG: hypothetical protein ABIG87_02685 [Patescibacteria group bacterium]
MGKGFETSALFVILSMFLLMFFTANAIQSKKKVLSFYFGLLFSFAVIALFHIGRLIFGPEFLSMGIFNSATANFIGSWSELGIFFGLTALLSLSASEFIGNNKVIKILNYIVLGIALFFVMLVNFSAVWVLLGILSVTLIVYNLYLHKVSGQIFGKKNISIPAIIVCVLSLIFVIGKGPIGGFLPTHFNISNMEVRPTTGSTIDIAQATLAKDPILGVGPNKFVNQWVTQKPSEINNTQFWNIDFNTGSSLILTSLITVGFLGFLSWLLFLGTLIYLGIKLVKKSQNNKFNHYLALSSFFAVVYLWMFSIIYVPGIVILGLSFLFAGILLSFFYQDEIIKIKTISLAQNKSALLVVTIAVIALLPLCGGYFNIKKATASIQSQKSLIAVNVEGDLGKAVELMTKASQTFKTDIYYRLLTEMNLVQLQFVLNQKDIPAETIQQQFQTVFGNTVANAQTAVNLGADDYQNWALLAKVYGAVVPLKIEGAYDNSSKAYIQAIQLNPKNPLLILSLANLEIANENIEKAKEYIVGAIQMKNNYSEAYYLMSQLESNAGNNEQAIKIIEALANVTPDDPQVFLQLGFMNYNKQDYKQAVVSLERSVGLNPYFADAKYLLGLTYDAIGEKEKAIGQFEDLKILIPNDTNISAILENIKNDRDPFYGLQQQTQAPADEEITETDEQIGEDEDAGDSEE